MYELDHLFVCAKVGAPEAERLVEFGLTEGTPNVHPGQGTANRRFFFANAMLELLWVNDAAEAQSLLVRSTRLWERWSDRENGASPFGLCFRSMRPAKPPPFATWEYHPSYLPAAQSISIGMNSDRLTEPMLLYLNSGRRPDSILRIDRPPLEHPAGLNEITRIDLLAPHEPPFSPELRKVIGSRLAGVRSGGEYLLEICFDQERQGGRADFRPDLPLIFRW